MERHGQEMAANELPETVEYTRKDFSFPLKSDDHLLMEPPMNGLSHFARPCPTTSMNEAQAETETGVIVEELTSENYKNSSLSLAKSSNKLGQGQRERMYHIGSRLEHVVLDGKANHMLLRAKEQLARMSYGNNKSKDIDQTPGGIALHLKATEDNLAIASNTLSVAAARLKTSSRPSFSQLFVKKGMKGKGIIRREQQDQPCLPGIDSSATEPSSNGISLREWLKPGSRKEDKVKRLIIFRQIVELVDSAHLQGVVLQDLRPSCFSLLSSNKVIYAGLSVKKGLESAVNNDLKRKRSLEQSMDVVNCSQGAKQLKHEENVRPPEHKMEFTSPHGSRTEMRNIDGFHTSIKQHSKPFINHHPFFHHATASVVQSPSAAIQMEERWYACPEEINGRNLTIPSNIYSLGVFLFELLCCFESMEQHSAMMSDLLQRILPANFLSECPKEAAFCLMLLHPEPLSRPTTRHGMRELVKDSVNTMNTKRGHGLSTFLKLTRQSLPVEVMTAL